ncbi:septum formation initiator [Rhodospirillum rubrum]|uniref:Septum formation initiator n=1 Tax=Rhodospirillum rubrum (strain ATCC 11170 / ATH 1.1.1 / DSM 467 / LMG 4362 / NCIMB 8255 / S1) TaxID=269796 RepID=Q2RT63_RHORT|nr:Septum formation initiator [Rhodospirillum rubrum ATCC 11170]MBK1663697.1 septum formation initiator [Rhodospirillum rubrum]MBK1677437.1 septum formation initiator [Rhodospirillum rubrum]MBK5954280.1 septum formation initiator [Rhodospirillum rubrum]HAQ00564.1 septum formation initiator [Rhodospirillum rubrum]
MSSIHKSRLRGFLGSLLALLVIAYFGYHGIQGDRGVLSLARLTKEIEEARHLLDLRRAEEAALQASVTRLSPESVDRDLLDERARIMLNRIRPDEVIIQIDGEPVSR